MTVSLAQYVKEAFHAKCFGMFLSPAWLILAVFCFLGGVLNPGFFLIGAGVELAYLFTLVSHPRFQAYVQNKIRGQVLLKEKAEWQGRVAKLIRQLDANGHCRFFELRGRCDSILDFYATQLSLDYQIINQHSQSLNKLIWIFLQLLMTKQAVLKVMEGSFSSQLQLKFTSDLADLDKQINRPDISEDLKKSLESQREILRLRLQTLKEAKEKLEYIDAELARIEQQVELIKEQAVMSKDSQGIANRIDLVSSSLNQTGEWIKQQEGLLGSLDDLTGSSPEIIPQREATHEAS
ncbi:MAG: hypothetical protein WCI27_01380 [Candidatus Omnitrophota bacterium]